MGGFVPGMWLLGSSVQGREEEYGAQQFAARCRAAQCYAMR